ncbi:phospholipase D-like domain-containing protein [Pseudomonas sp. NBRC 100443]|uniref:phospholipase D-like domain-containing protein n=1 Tax=Pseudomonas sp. NBRC 100443 TaxID=1113665 RepID=UPI0025547C16|nr:phospholipase D-like domain-containing protein [Pseudomonas sp. NBRC 100443]
MESCPIATSMTQSGNVNLRWFVPQTEYSPLESTFEPLVNGERAFGAVYDAIVAAKHSVEIICWGFQPSMYFRRGDRNSLCIGELLARKGAEGVKVRVLCWYDSLHIAQYGENMTPGDNLGSSLNRLRSRDLDLRNEAQRELDDAWYSQARLSNVKQGRGPLELTQDFFNKLRFGGDPTNYFANVEFVTRDFGLLARAEIAWRVAMRGDDSERSRKTKAANATAMSAEPSHHQKMVLVDYEHPEMAMGFVMGHNMLDAYWDKDDHSHLRMHAQMGRNGLTPRQDISSRVTGRVLEALNLNFCEAWKMSTGIDLLPPRKAIACQLKPRSGFGQPLMTQVLRTQSQVGRQDIKQLYKKAANNVTQFIYIENQYFRWEPLAKLIKQTAVAHLEKGRDPGKDGPIHLFVVTNSSDAGMGDGTINTYRMLESLGRADVLPKVAEAERNDALDRELAKANQNVQYMQMALGSYNNDSRLASIPASAVENLKKRLEKAIAERDELARKISKQKQDNKTIVPTEVPGLKVHVCTLVAPDSPPGNWMDVYIHSKLMIVDDVFMTLGSANINTRSMEVDSELNICHEDAGITKPLRQSIWGIHTKGMGAQDDPAEAFKQWQLIINQNKSRLESNRASGGGHGASAPRYAPFASLVEFFRDSPKRSRLD